MYQNKLRINKRHMKMTISYIEQNINTGKLLCYHVCKFNFIK